MTYSRRAIVLLTCVAFVVSGLPARAHHSAAAFDVEHPITMTATVTEWYWANPHCLLQFDVTDPAGRGATHWVAETSNPRDMTNQGWTKASLRPGDKVTITVQPAHSGKPVGRVAKVVRADGTTLVAYVGPRTAAGGQQ
jgi:hypothetical protein